jgi:hypothetical protein
LRRKSLPDAAAGGAGSDSADAVAESGISDVGLLDAAAPPAAGFTLEVTATGARDVGGGAPAAAGASIGGDGAWPIDSTLA